MRRFVVLAFIAVSLMSAGALRAGTVTFAGTLVDRQCSVEDVLRAQAASAKRCTLWVQDSTGRIVTAYCPNQKTINGVTYSSYVTCADPTAAQIGRPVTLGGNLRSCAEMADGYGEFIVVQVSF